MSSSFFKRFYSIMISLFIIILSINFLFIPTIAGSIENSNINSISFTTPSTNTTHRIEINTTGFTWPLPRV